MKIKKIKKKINLVNKIKVIENIVASLSKAPTIIYNNKLATFFECRIELGKKI